MPFRRVAAGIATVGHRDNRLRPLQRAKADKPEQDRGVYDISIFHTLVCFIVSGFAGLGIHSGTAGNLARYNAESFLKKPAASVHLGDIRGRPRMTRTSRLEGQSVYSESWKGAPAHGKAVNDFLRNVDWSSFWFQALLRCKGETGAVSL